MLHIICLLWGFEDNISARSGSAGTISQARRAEGSIFGFWLPGSVLLGFYLQGHVLTMLTVCSHGPIMLFI